MAQRYDFYFSYCVKSNNLFHQRCSQALHGQYLRFQEFTQVHGKQATSVSEKQGLF